MQALKQYNLTGLTATEVGIIMMPMMSKTSLRIPETEAAEAFMLEICFPATPVRRESLAPFASSNAVGVPIIKGSLGK